MRLVCSTLALVSVVAARPLAAQTPLATATDARGSPGGAVLGSLRAGATVTVGVRKGADVLVTVEGWVDASLLGAKRDTFPASVGGNSLVRLRATPSLRGAILGELKPGTGVKTVAKQGTWTRVTRSAWIPSSVVPNAVIVAPGPAKAGAKAAEPKRAGAKALEQKKAGPRPPPQEAATSVPSPGEVQAAPAGSMSASRATKVLASPGGRAVGDLSAGSVVQPLARDRGWMRVRVEGWVSERDLAPADSAFGANLTAADLRADPDGTKGKIVRWEVQTLSLQTADPLRREMARDEPYLLAKGPAGENALLYLAIPPSLLTEVKAIPPLTMVIITARVRVGRSEPVGTPILDLKTITRR
jgi:hypothetical protein